MTSVLRSILPVSSAKSEDHDDDYSVEYSFAMEYSGPPVSQDIPQVAPVDVRRIPTAAVAARGVMLSNLSLPVVQPIVKKSDHQNKKVLEELKSSGSEAAHHQVTEAHVGKIGLSGRVYSRKSGNCSYRNGKLAIEEGGDGESNVFGGAQSSSSSGTMGFSDGHDDSNHLSESSDVEDLDDNLKAGVSYGDCSNATTSNSNEDVEDCADEVSGQGHRASVVTFRDLPSNDSMSEQTDHDGHEIIPERRLVLDDVKKGLCNRCCKKNRFAGKEVCIVCGAKYCSKCVIKAMGSMPEGRKCIACIGYRIDESKRGSLGKCSRMLKRLLGDEAIKQIMSAEISCEVNQLPPHLIFVNDKPLSIEELVMLQSCPNPPKKLRPGKYWYDKVSGFWGKDGEQPCQIISAQLAVGYQIRQDASNGNTNVMINNREITKAEFWMLQAAGIHCEGNPHFWVTADGSYQHEGMNYVMGKLWEKKRVRIVCAALSLPFPSDITNTGGEDIDNNSNKVNSKNQEQDAKNKLLLVGCDQSGTSTIYKQARILYSVPFSEDEKQNIKTVIQRNLYRYIAIILEGREQFEEDHMIEMRRRNADEPGPSGSSDQVDKKNAYSFSPRLESFSSFLLQLVMSGELEAIFPAATREYSPMVEELWKDKAFQAIYKRRNELHLLPRVANYFLDRAVEISRIDYEPSEMDILYAEGITSSNGVASVDFSFPKSSQDGYMESSDQNDPSISYQLIRVHVSSLGEHCKWLEMFEDVDLVTYSVSLTDYDEYYEDINGIRTNKMLAAKKLFESIVTHPTLAEKHFLLILNKFDLLEDKIERVPLTQCDWFHDFNPVISLHPHSATSSNNPPLAQRAFHYIAVQFKRLFHSLTERKLFVSRVTGLEADSVDKALRYSKEILKWSEERNTVSLNEWSTESMEPSTSA
ncbi:extra-large guanine nucleotide-binding protein 1 [Sesamum indicum]|uniref:Extra-large guanine nucleotide-binding protein 1 n=1 Tax=Sesamum indicum TaxID=4182 RepID=A0A6I9TTV4_SESIN|nr:extra-large guanine nucleotide-binding protein 1 [Sesamum indicum]